ncbi:MAG: class I SAM-dependent methyltransferase [Candidatus Helarchaeota archaeon]
MMKTEIIRFWEKNVVCPECKGNIKINDSSILCKQCQKSYLFNNMVPNFVGLQLSEHQKSELELYKYKMKKIHARKNYFNQNERCYSWVTNWINNEIINDDDKIICIGGAYLDDLPHVKSNYKFNVDHLAHRLILIFPEIINGNVKHLAAKSEKLPFKDEYADIVYSRNSLDHVNNPIKTLLEINRILKPKGKFFVLVYFNSNFIDSHETTVIEKFFVNNHLKRIFNINWMKIKPSESQNVIQPPPFSLPNRKKLKFLYAVCEKKDSFNSYDKIDLENHEKLITNFQAAIFYEEKKQSEKASQLYFKVMNSTPFLKTDENRILFSKIRFLALNDQKKFKELFLNLKKTNLDPFWWKIIIKSSISFMENEIKNTIKKIFSGKERKFLERYIKKIRISNLIDQIPFFNKFLKSIFKHFRIL